MRSATTAIEHDVRHDRVRELLDRHGASAVVLRLASSFAWATGGISSVVNQAASTGEGIALYTHESRVLLANAIEAPRYELETPATDRGWELVVQPWESDVDPLHPWRTGTVLSDTPGEGVVDVAGELALLRAALQPGEQERMRALGQACAASVELALRETRRHDTEFQLAARVAARALEFGIEPIVLLVAADERIHRIRHPRPTSARIDAYAMAVLCGRRDGLVCSVTRLAHRGAVPADLRRKLDAVVHVDAALLAASRPAATLGAAFQAAVEAYAEVGFAEEWRNHHQGGLAGYEPREVVARPRLDVAIPAGAACAWNPSVPGAKSEDTVLVTGDGAEVVTDTGEWPRLQPDGVDAPPRPDVLGRDDW